MRQVAQVGLCYGKRRTTSSNSIEKSLMNITKRSNVESTIGAIKQKFGETLKSKNRVAQENKLLCKILAYNSTVLIHEMFESGITPDFLTLKSAG